MKDIVKFMVICVSTFSVTILTSLSTKEGVFFALGMAILLELIDLNYNKENK